MERIAAELSGKGIPVPKGKSQTRIANDMDKKPNQENFSRRNVSLQESFSSDDCIRDNRSTTQGVPNTAFSRQSAIQKSSTMAQGKPEFRSRIPRPNKKKGALSRSRSSLSTKDQLKECLSESKPAVPCGDKICLSRSRDPISAQRSNNVTHWRYKKESDSDDQVQQKGSSNTSLAYQRLVQQSKSPAAHIPPDCLQYSLSTEPQTQDINGLNEARENSRKHISSECLLQRAESSLSTDNFAGKTENTFLVQDSSKPSTTNMPQSENTEHKDTLSKELCSQFIQTLPVLDSAYNTMICSSEDENGPKDKQFQHVAHGDCSINKAPSKSLLPIRTSAINMSHCSFHNSKIQADSHCSRPPLTQVGVPCCALCQDKTTCSRTGGHECYSLKKAQSSLSDLNMSGGRYVNDVPTPPCCSSPEFVVKQQSSTGTVHCNATGSMEGIPLIQSGGTTSSWGSHSTKTITLDEQVIDEDIQTEKYHSSSSSLAHQNQPFYQKNKESEYEKSSTQNDEKDSLSTTNSNSAHFKKLSLASSRSTTSVGGLLVPTVSSNNSIVKSDSKRMLHGEPVLSSAYLDALKKELTRLREQVSKPHVVSKCSSMVSLPLTSSSGSAIFAESAASTSIQKLAPHDSVESELRGVRSTPNLSSSSCSSDRPLLNKDCGSGNYYVSGIHELPSSLKGSFNSRNHSSSSSEHHGSSIFLNSSSCNKSLTSFVGSRDSDLFHKSSPNCVSTSDSSGVHSKRSSYSNVQRNIRLPKSLPSSSSLSPSHKEKQGLDWGNGQTSPSSKSSSILLTPLSGSVGHMSTSVVGSSNGIRLCTPVKSPLHTALHHTITDALPRDQTSSGFSMCSTPVTMPVLSDCQIYTPEGSPWHGAPQFSRNSMHDELKSSSLISMDTYQLRNPSVQFPWSHCSGIQSQWPAKNTVDDNHFSNQPASQLSGQRQPTNHLGSANQLSSSSHFESQVGSVSWSDFEPGRQRRFSSQPSSCLPTQCTSRPSSLSEGSQAALSSSTGSQHGSPLFKAAGTQCLIHVSTPCLTDEENISASAKVGDTPALFELQAPPSSPQLLLSSYPSSSIAMDNWNVGSQEYVSDAVCPIGESRSPNSGYSNSTAVEAQFVSRTEVMSASTSEVSAQINQDQASGILSLSMEVTPPKTESGSYNRPLQGLQLTPLNSPTRLSIKGIQSDTSTPGTSIYETSSPVLHSQGKLQQNETTTRLDFHHRPSLNTISEGMESLSISEAGTQTSFKNSIQGSQGTLDYHDQSVSGNFDTVQLSNSSCFPVSEMSTTTSFNRSPKPLQDDSSKNYSMKTTLSRIGDQSISHRRVYSPVNSNSTIDNLSSEGSVPPRNFKGSTRTSSQSLCTPVVTDSPKQIGQLAMALSRSNSTSNSAQFNHDGRDVPSVHNVRTPSNSRYTPSWTKPHTFSQDTLQNFSPLNTPMHNPHIWLQRCTPAFSTDSQVSLPVCDQSPALVNIPSQNTEEVKNDILNGSQYRLLSNSPELNEEKELNYFCSQRPNSTCEELDSPSTPSIDNSGDTDNSFHFSGRYQSEVSSLEELEKLLENEMLKNILDDETGNEEECEELLDFSSIRYDCDSNNTSKEGENEAYSIASQCNIDDVLTSPSFSLRKSSRCTPSDAPSFWEKGFSTPHSSDQNIQAKDSHSSVNRWEEASVQEEGRFLREKPSDHFSTSKSERSKYLEHTGRAHRRKLRQSPLRSTRSSSQSHLTSNIIIPTQEPVISTDRIFKRKVSKQPHHDLSQQTASNTKSDSTQLWVPPQAKSESIQTNVRRENYLMRDGRSRSDKCYKCARENLYPASACTSTDVYSNRHPPGSASFDQHACPHCNGSNSQSSYFRPNEPVVDHKYSMTNQRERVMENTPANCVTSRSSNRKGFLRHSHFSPRRNQRVDNLDQFPYSREQRRGRGHDNSHKRAVQLYCHELHKRKRRHPGRVRLINYFIISEIW